MFYFFLYVVKHKNTKQKKKKLDVTFILYEIIKKICNYTVLLQCSDKILAYSSFRYFYGQRDIFKRHISVFYQKIHKKNLVSVQFIGIYCENIATSFFTCINFQALITTGMKRKINCARVRCNHITC